MIGSEFSSIGNMLIDSDVFFLCQQGGSWTGAAEFKPFQKLWSFLNNWLHQQHVWLPFSFLAALLQLQHTPLCLARSSRVAARLAAAAQQRNQKKNRRTRCRVVEALLGMRKYLSHNLYICSFSRRCSFVHLWVHSSIFGFLMLVCRPHHEGVECFLYTYGVTRSKTG